MRRKVVVSTGVQDHTCLKLLLAMQYVQVEDTYSCTVVKYCRWGRLLRSAHRNVKPGRSSDPLPISDKGVSSATTYKALDARRNISHSEASRNSSVVSTPLPELCYISGQCLATIIGVKHIYARLRPYDIISLQRIA